MTQRFTVLEGRIAVCRLDPGQPIPTPPASAIFWSVTMTHVEISVVCEETLAPRSGNIERSWRAIKILGPLDFSLQGVLSRLLGPLAEMKLGVFVMSTYDTDYILVKEFDLPKAIEALISAGHERLPS